MENSADRSTGPESCSEVHLDGEFDVATGAYVLDAVRAALRGGPSEVSLDMGGVTFIDCAGLESVRNALALAARQGTAAQIINASAAVRRLLALTAAAEAQHIR